MRSGRKLSTNPMSAMPGRFTSLIVISRRDASDSVSGSSCSSCRWSSNSRATLRLCTSSVFPVLVDPLVGSAVRRHTLPGESLAVHRAGAALALNTLLLEPAQLLLDPAGRHVDGLARLGRVLVTHQLVVLEPQRD